MKNDRTVGQIVRAAHVQLDRAGVRSVDHGGSTIDLDDRVLALVVGRDANRARLARLLNAVRGLRQAERQCHGEPDASLLDAARVVIDVADEIAAARPNRQGEGGER